MVSLSDQAASLIKNPFKFYRLYSPEVNYSFSTLLKNMKALTKIVLLLSMIAMSLQWTSGVEIIGGDTNSNILFLRPFFCDLLDNISKRWAKSRACCRYIGDWDVNVSVLHHRTNGESFSFLDI